MYDNLPFINWFDWFLNSTNLLLFLVPTAVFVIGEHIFRSNPNPSWSKVFENAIYVTTLLVIYIYLLPALYFLAATVATFFGGPYFDLTTNANGSLWPMLLGLFAYILAFDFFYYWHHRLQHENRYLWLTHKLHHADENLNATTTFKHHWTDDSLRLVTMHIPMGLLFKFEPVTIFWLNYFLVMHGILVHTSIRISYGPLTSVLLGPQLHRIHHSFAPQHLDKNYAFYFPLLDRIFGTYYHPKADEFPDTGLCGGEKIDGVVRAHAYPFIDAFKMLRRHVRRKEKRNSSIMSRSNDD